MGRAIVLRIMDSDDLQLHAAIGRAGGDLVGELVVGAGTLRYSGDLAGALAGCDVLIDFSLASATAAIADAAADAGVALLSGVTGLDAAAEAALDAAAVRVPVLHTNNTSLGVTLMMHLLEVSRAALPGARVRLHEVHHAAKLDAPSGTAMMMGLVTGVPVAEITHQRTGDVPGEHEVVFDLGAERLELNHRVSDRGVFADGALIAARWLAGKPAGRYSMAEVLGLE